MALAAFALFEISNAMGFGALALAVGGLGVVFIFSTYNTPSRETNGDAMVFLVLFWLLVPMITAVPFLFSGAVPNFTVAYFEAASAITTTGATTLDTDSLPKSLLLWRSLLQWFGGVFAATFAVVILAALNLTGTGVHRSLFFTLKRGELLNRLVGVGRIIAAIYASVSAVCFIGLSISGTPIFESLCLAMTSVSTGGLMPRSGVLENYVSAFGSFILALACLTGAISIAVLWDALRLRTRVTLKRLFTNVESRAIGIIIALLVLVGLLFTGYGHMGTVFFEAIFFATSTGYDHHVIGLEMLPPAVLITVALIGGAVLSTAGGVKIIRLLLLFRHVATDMNRLTHPSRVVPVKFRGQTIPDRAFLSIWMYFFGYTLVFALAIMALSATGMTYETATAAGAAALSNMGPLLDATLPVKTYFDFSDLQLTVLSFVMLIGRVEVLAVFAVLSPATWRK